MEKNVINEVNNLTKKDFNTEETELVYRKIIELHTIKNESYSSKSYPRSNYSGISKNNNFPLRRDVGEQLFGNKDKSTVTELYLSCVAHIQNFKACYPEMKKWFIKVDIALEHLLIQSFFTWVLSCDNSKNVRNKIFLKKVESDGDRSIAKAMISENSKNGINQTTENTSGKIPISKQQKIRIIRQLIKINFPQQMKIWPLVFKTLAISGPLEESFIDEFGEERMKGNVSFSTVEYCLTSSSIARCLGSPDFIIQAVLLGPLKGCVVESFLSEKAMYFRDEAKKLLEEAERWAKSSDRDAFNKAVVKYTHMSVDDSKSPDFHLFISNIRNLMLELRRQNIAENFVSISYAYSICKRVAKKFYVEKILIREQLDDVFHSIICQHPSVKTYVVKMLRNDFKDEKAASQWQKFGPQYHDRYKMSTVFEKVDYHAEPKPGCLPLDNNVEIFVVDTVNKLKILENEISRCEREEFPCVGLDSEWNPFISPSKAALLQIAFERTVYLVDLETLRGKNILSQILDRLFLSKVLKIGFQFSDDLVAIRESIPMCRALYTPENVICVGKLISQLLAQSKVNSNSLIEVFFPKLANEVDCGAALVEEDEDLVGNSKNLALDSSSGDLVRTHGSAENITETTKNMGLSTVCQRMLGLRLEKSEQCSIWDRRPLRYRQVRYAAIDAWCCLKLYQKCVEWSKKLGCNMKELVLAQGKIHFSLPLFWKPY